MKDKTNLGRFKMSFWGDHIISDIENYQVGPGKMAIWFIGCTGNVLKSSKTLIYIDPFLGRPARPANTREMTPIPFKPEQVRKADAILSTHRHRDHCHKETLVPIYNNTEALFIGPETSNKKFLEFGIDDSRMKVMKPDEEISFFDMKIIACDPYVCYDECKSVEKGDLFKDSDIISLHVPLTDETRGMINKETIAQMKDGIIIINTARGKLINEADLAEAIKSGKVKYAGIDVFETEPPVGSPLLEADNILLTPHLGANTYENMDRIGEIVVNIIRDFRISKTM